MNSDRYQARAGVEAANAETENQRQRYEESHERWLEMAVRAREFEAGQAERLADEDRAKRAAYGG